MRHPSPTQTPALTLPCTLADRYELRRRIGIGASAEVFLGWDRELGREVAIKRLRRESELDPSELARMRREAQQLAAARVDPMTEIYDIRTNGNDRFLVLRHIAGRSLDKVIAQNGPLSVEVTLQVIADVLEALLDQHRCHRPHHDVVPENILVDDSGRAVLLDLGDSHDHGTCTGDRVDILQVGMLMFYAAFGCAPPADNVALTTVTVPGRPACFSAVILSALAAPEDRFVSVEAMAEAVRVALREVMVTEVGIDEIVDAEDAVLAADAVFADGDAVDESERATTEMAPVRRSPQPLPLPIHAPPVRAAAGTPSPDAAAIALAIAAEVEAHLEAEVEAVADEVAAPRRRRPKMTRGTWQRIAIGGAFAAVAASSAVVTLVPPMSGEASAAIAPPPMPDPMPAALVAAAAPAMPIARGSVANLDDARHAPPPPALVAIAAAAVAPPKRRPPAEIVFDIPEPPPAAPVRRAAPPPPIPAAAAKPRVVQIPPKVPTPAQGVVGRPAEDASPAQLAAYAEQHAKTGAPEAAIAAGRRYLRLAPDGADAPRMRQMLTELEIAAR